MSSAMMRTTLVVLAARAHAARQWRCSATAAAARARLYLRAVMDSWCSPRILGVASPLTVPMHAC